MKGNSLIALIVFLLLFCCLIVVCIASIFATPVLLTSFLAEYSNSTQESGTIENFLDIPAEDELDIEDEMVEQEQNIFEIGEAIEAANITWKVTDAQKLGDTLDGKDSRYATEYYTPDSLTTNGYFLKVDLEIENTSDTPETISLSNLKVLDGEEKQYESTLRENEWVKKDRHIVFEQLNPGAELQASLIFEIPNNDAKDLKLHIKDRAYSSVGDTIIDLNL